MAPASACLRTLSDALRMTSDFAAACNPLQTLLFPFY
jgi:hypothetical protein